MGIGNGIKALVAICVIASLVFLTIYGSLIVWNQYNISSQTYREYQEQTKRYEKQAAEKIERECSVIVPMNPAFRNCLLKAIESYQSDDRSKKDLKAQQDMAYWAFLLTIISLVGTIFSGLGVWAVFTSLRQTRIAISDTREIGQAEIRAYVALEFERGQPIKIQDSFETRKFTGQFSYRNFGSTPAMNTRYIATFQPLKHPIDDDWIVLPVENQSGGTKTLHQNESDEGLATASAYPVREITPDMRSGDGDVGIYFAGAIFYEDIFDNTQCTRFCFQIIQPQIGDTGFGAMSFIKAPFHNDST